MMDAATRSTVERDLHRLLAIQALRAFAYGFGTVVIPTALEARGISTARAALVFSAMLAGMAVMAIVVGLVGDKIGRRRAYVGLLAIMGFSGAVFALSGNVAVLALVGLTGTMSTDANESGPITSLEQAMIGQAPRSTRLRVFGRYNALAYLAGALGALAVRGPAFARGLFPSLPSDQRWLVVFPIVAAVGVHLASGLSDAVERPPGDRTPPLRRSRRNVLTLASLFSLDSFAGGFVVTTFVVFWFERRFGASESLMSLVVFAGGLLQAVSSVVAARLGGVIGLLNTMVLTHLPSNVLLALVPLMPTLPLAVAVLLSRFALSQMDVPTRQAYLAAMVDPEERTAAAAFTNTARYVSRPFGPAVGAALANASGIGAPFVAAGALKVLYDLVLYGVFRRLPLPDS
jgi:predicted MFS family arabinose efflux permease